MKFVQIAVLSTSTETEREATLYALADDGTIWYTTASMPHLSEYQDSPWAPLPLLKPAQKRWAEAEGGQ